MKNANETCNVGTTGTSDQVAGAIMEEQLRYR